MHDLLNLNQSLVDRFIAAEAEELQAASLLLVPKTPQCVTGRYQRPQWRAGRAGDMRQALVLTLTLGGIFRKEAGRG